MSQPPSSTDTQPESSSDDRETRVSPDTLIDVGSARAVDAMLERVTTDAARRLARLRPLARGGMATVEIASDETLQRRVAMKLMRPDLQRRRRAVASFIREAQITGQLDHPNIVPVHEIGTTDDGQLYFSMKLVEGRTLAELVEELPEGPIESNALFELLDVVIKVCDALSLAHARGVLHCDLKPENIMVGNYGQVYLMDWGIARIMDADEGVVAQPVRSWIEDRATASGITGTPAFMSPEQATGRVLDERADVFAVGALIYYIIARRPPYQSRSHTHTFMLAQSGEFPPPAEVVPKGTVSEALNRLILRAMDRDPEKRFRSVTELKRHLLRFMRGGGDFPRARFDAGDEIVTEGDPADAAYIIVSGRTEVFRLVEGERVHLGEMGPGEVFGETAILASSPRTATVAALEPTVVMVVTRDVFEQEVDHMKPWMGAFLRTLARRFRHRVSVQNIRGTPTLVDMARQALMFANTWGDAEGAAREVEWAAFADYMEQTFGVEAFTLETTLRQHPELEVDTKAGRLRVADAQALAESLDVPEDDAADEDQSETP